jgi:hypothetical protein
MVNIFSALRKYFAFTTTLNEEAHYYEQPISRSRYFRGYTTNMACAEVIGMYVVCRYWVALPWISRLFLVVTLMSLIGAWVRAIANHAKIRKRLANVDLSGLPSELLKEAAGESNFGLSLLAGVVLILIFAWAFTIAHYQTILANPCHGGGWRTLDTAIHYGCPILPRSLRKGGRPRALERPVS